MFVGREAELEYLNKKYNGTNAEMVVLYGRRRIGKTELIREFLKDKDFVFYAASEVDDYEQLKRFSKIIKDKMGLENIDVSFDSWDDLFKSIKKIKVKDKLVVAIDEFPYMVNGNKAIPSLIQNLWDHELKDLNVFFIFTGSSVGIMLDDILGSNNPLYGRITGSYKLDELSIWDLKSFFPDYSQEDIITTYSILGGVPQYLLCFDPGLSVEDNIKGNILEKGVFLYDEVQMLMKQELREATTYFTILEAIAMGNTKLNQIHQMTQIEKTKITTYLGRLIHMDLVEREHPVTEKLKKKVNVQSGLYQLKNNYFRFYFRYLFPSNSLLELKAVEGVYNNIIKNDLNVHVSQVFEKICIDYVMQRNIAGKLPVFAMNCGRWWHKQEEIDIVAFDSANRYVFGECKWRNEKVSVKILEDLKAKINRNFSKAETAKIFLFSKSGFDDRLIDLCKADGRIELVEVNGILNTRRLYD